MDFINLYVGAKINKKEINYKKIKEKEFEVNLILDKLNEYLCFILKIKLMQELMLFKFLTLGLV